MDPSSEFVPRVLSFLHDIGHRHIQPPPPTVALQNDHHHWMHNVLGPLTSWSTAKLSILEKTSVTLFDRSYPFADVATKAILAKLAAIALLIDDSLDDERMYDDIGSFAHRVYLGESQTCGILSLYHRCIQEMSMMYDGDPVLRGLFVLPWITFVDACLLEKRLLTVDNELGASPRDLGYHQMVEAGIRGGPRNGASKGDTVASLQVPFHTRTHVSLNAINSPLHL